MKTYVSDNYVCSLRSEVFAPRISSRSHGNWAQGSHVREEMLCQTHHGLSVVTSATCLEVALRK